MEDSQRKKLQHDRQFLDQDDSITSSDDLSLDFRQKEDQEFDPEPESDLTSSNQASAKTAKFHQHVPHDGNSMRL